MSSDEDYMKESQESVTKQAEMAGRKQVNDIASGGNKKIYDTLNKGDKKVLKRPAIKQSPKR